MQFAGPSKDDLRSADQPGEAVGLKAYRNIRFSLLTLITCDNLRAQEQQSGHKLDKLPESIIRVLQSFLFTKARDSLRPRGMPAQRSNSWDAM